MAHCCFHFEVTEPGQETVTSLPTELVEVPCMVSDDANNKDSPRPMVLTANPFTINDKQMDMDRIDEEIALGATEIWEISNPNNIAHPFHVHGDSFQNLSREGAEPPEHERAWKDNAATYAARKDTDSAQTTQGQKKWPR